MFTLDRYHDQLVCLHDHVCPRQILGLRAGELAGRVLGIDLPQGGRRKQLLALVETDGCFADGVMMATGCSMGHRTMRLMDQGKVAVTFVDLDGDTSTGLRIWPRSTVRQQARLMCPNHSSRWHAQLEAYQRLTDEQLLDRASVELLVSVQLLVSRHGHRVICEQCGEEIINERERHIGERLLCRHCSGDSYFSSPLDFAPKSAVRSEVGLFATPVSIS